MWPSNVSTRCRPRGGRVGALEQAEALDLYLLLDGWFRYFLQQHLSGNAQAGALFRQRLEQLLDPALKPANIQRED